MRKTIVVLFFTLLASAHLLAYNDLTSCIKLLPGYKIKQGRAVDAAVWTIQKDGGGLTIEFEAGLNEGAWANPKNMSQYAWYKEQVVNGHKIILALIKPGLKTDWETDSSAALHPGNILLVTFPLGIQPDHTANFKAKVSTPEELADMLLMV